MFRKIGRGVIAAAVLCVMAVGSVSGASLTFGDKELNNPVNGGTLSGQVTIDFRVSSVSCEAEAKASGYRIVFYEALSSNIGDDGLGRVATASYNSPSGLARADCEKKKKEIINKLESAGMYGALERNTVEYGMSCMDKQGGGHVFYKWVMTTTPSGVTTPKQSQEGGLQEGSCEEAGFNNNEKIKLSGVGNESRLGEKVQEEITKRAPSDKKSEGSGDCASILPDSWCDMEDGNGIIMLLRIVLDILTAGVGILATIGMVISGIQYIMARDDAGKVAKVKSRIFNIVIGLLAYGVMWIVLEWLIPGGVL